MEMSYYNYTLNMKNLFEDELQSMVNYYCREDFEVALNNVLEAKEDNIIFERKKLKELCDARGMDIEMLIKDKTLLNNIPTRIELKDNILQGFYDMCKAAPDTIGFMERLVRRLAPEYGSDTLRAAILKKFLIGSDKKIGPFRTDGIIKLGEAKLSDSERKEYAAMSKPEKRQLLVSKIDDLIFKTLKGADHINFIADRLTEYKNDSGILFDELLLDEKTQNGLNEFLDKYGLNEEGLSCVDKVLKISGAVKDSTIPNAEEIPQELIDAIDDALFKQLKNIDIYNRVCFIEKHLIKYKEDSNIWFVDLWLDENTQDGLNKLLDKYEMNKEGLSSVDKVLELFNAIQNNEIPNVEEIPKELIDDIEGDLFRQLKNIDIYNRIALIADCLTEHKNGILFDALTLEELKNNVMPKAEEIPRELLDAIDDALCNRLEDMDIYERIYFLAKHLMKYKDAGVISSKTQDRLNELMDKYALNKRKLSPVGKVFKIFEAVQNNVIPNKKEIPRELIDEIDGVLCERLKDISIYERIALMADCLTESKEDIEIPFDDLTLDKRMQTRLNNILNKYELNEEGLSSADKVLRIFEALGNNVIPRAEEISRELLETIEGDLSKRLKNIYEQKVSQRYDSLSDAYKQAKPDQRSDSLLYAYKQTRKARTDEIKESGPKLDYSLLEMCHNLANGNFKKGSKTRMYLYYFAFMFNMTFSINEYDECDEETDIVKNLFHDYYNDNILRFFNGMYTDSESEAYAEKMPTGEGINYKNFAEAIYIYYLNKGKTDRVNGKNSVMLPGERINKAEKLIDNCVKTAKKMIEDGEIDINNTDVQYTYVFKNKMAEMLDRDEDSLLDYIVHNYRVVIPNNTNVGRIYIDSEEITAFEWISSIMEEVSDYYYLDANLLDLRWKDNDEERKTIRKDLLYYTENLYDWGIKELLAKKFSDDEAFLDILKALDERTAGRRMYITKSERMRILVLLHILASQSSSEKPLSVKDDIREGMDKGGEVFAGTELQDAVKLLRALGYDVKKVKMDTSGDEGAKGQIVKYGYYLDNRKYDDSLLNELLTSVSGRYMSINDSKEAMFTKLFNRYYNTPGRATRTDMILFHFYNYILSIDIEKNGMYSFPELFVDYTESIDPILEYARYQRISPKNIFDMYIVTALYLYVLDMYYPEN